MEDDDHAAACRALGFMRLFGDEPPFNHANNCDVALDSLNHARQWRILWRSHFVDKLKDEPDFPMWKINKWALQLNKLRQSKDQPDKRVA